MSLSPAEMAFQEASIAAFRRLAPGARVGVLPGLRLRVLLADGRALSVGLADAFHAFLDAGGKAAELDDAAGAHASHALQALGPSADAGGPAALGREPFEDAMARVLPLVESVAFFEAADEAAAAAPPLLRFPFVAGELSIALVLPGTGASMRFLSQADLARWQKPAELVEHQARQNLDARARGRLALGLRHGVVVVVDSSPWFQATLAVLPSFRARVADVLGDRPLLALPARDCLIGLAAAEEARWKPALGGFAQRFVSDRHPLTSALFACEPDGLRLAGRLPVPAG